jgi:hypothetical protein
MLEKLNCYVTRLSVFLIMAALIAGIAGCDGDDYIPSADLEIQTWYDLDDVRDNLEGHHTLMNDLDSTTPGYTELASPTANGGNGWDPIGWGYWGNGGVECGDVFKGTFDGQGHKIIDLVIDRSDQAEVGLFGFVGKQGNIKNVAVVNATVVGSYGVEELLVSYDGSMRTLDIWTMGDGSAVGILAGYSSGTVSNCYSTGNVTGKWAVGGLVGYSGGTLSDSYACGRVNGWSSVGGLVGLNVGIWGAGTVSNSYYDYDEVLVNGENVITIGALFEEDFHEWLTNGRFLDVNDRLHLEDGYYVANNISDFKQVLAFGQNETMKFRLASDLDLSGEPNFYIPYLAGEVDGAGCEISNLSFDFDYVSQVGLFGYLGPSGEVSGIAAKNVSISADDYVGGLVGCNGEGTISQSCATGKVNGKAHVGGLVGDNRGTVSECCATATVTGERWRVGGLVGYNDKGAVTNCYSTGNVIGNHNLGGLVGWNYRGTISDCYSTGSITGSSAGGLVQNNQMGTVRHSFWDMETSGQDTSDGGTGKTTAQMKNIATFSGVMWDIIGVGGPGERNPAYIWNIVGEETYPFLSWQPV